MLVDVSVMAINHDAEAFEVREGYSGPCKAMHCAGTNDGAWERYPRKRNRGSTSNRPELMVNELRRGGRSCQSVENDVSAGSFPDGESARTREQTGG